MKRRVALVVVVALAVGLLINALLVGRTTRSAEPFAGGHVLELEGPDLNVREYGGTAGDRAIVLLHGYTSSIEWWEQVAPKLAETGQRVIAIDLVGHGGSEAPGEDDEYGAAGQAAAVVQALKALKVEHAVLVGHSMGGHVATAVAERNPELVEKVAVVDTYGDSGLRDLPLLKEAGCWPVLGEFIDRFRGLDAATDSSLQTGFADDYPVPALAHRSLEQLTHRGVCEAKAGDQLNDERPVAERLAGLGKPVLVVWGGRDVLTPTAENVAAYERSGLKPHLIAESGHSPHVEKPDALVAELLPFVNS